MRKIIQFIKNISPFNGRTEMPKILYIIKVILVFYVFKFGSELVGEALAIGVHFACGKNPLEGEMFDMNTITIISYLGYGVMIGVVILLWKLFQKKNPSELGFTKNIGSYFIGILAGTVLLAVCVVPVVLTGSIKFNGIFENIDTGMVLSMIPCFIFQGAMEEVLCRGVVQQLLTKNVSVPVAFAVSAVLFTIPHLGNMDGASPAIKVIGVVNLVLMSVVFSALAHRFKNIWVTCGFHSVWNYILYTVMGLNLSGKDEIVASIFDMSTVGDNVLNGGSYGIEAGIVTTVVLAVTVLILVSAIIISTRKKQGTSRSLKDKTHDRL